MTKHKTHSVRLYKYNFDNLKEVLDIEKYEIKYVPTDKWNWYLVLVNGKWTGQKLNLSEILSGQKLSPRKIVGESIKGYKEGKDFNYQNRVKVYYPSDDVYRYTQKVWNTKILNMGDFKKRDENTEIGLI